MINTAHNHLLAKVPRNLTSLSFLLEKNGPILLPRQRSKSLSAHLSRTIVGQQLSKAAADSIWCRIEKLSIAKALSLEELFMGEDNSELKACGISKYKIKALKNLHVHFTENPSLEERLWNASSEVIINEIIQVWGLGQWSAEMALIFFFHKEDVWSLDDAALRKGIKIITNNDLISTRDIKEFTEGFAPFRTYLALHIWQGIDTKLI